MLGLTKVVCLLIGCVSVQTESKKVYIIHKSAAVTEPRSTHIIYRQSLGEPSQKKLHSQRTFPLRPLAPHPPRDNVHMSQMRAFYLRLQILFFPNRNRTFQYFFFRNKNLHFHSGHGFCRRPLNTKNKQKKLDGSSYKVIKSI